MSLPMRIVPQRTVSTCVKLSKAVPINASKIHGEGIPYANPMLYDTKDDHKKMVYAQRTHDAPEEYGEHPTKWQKKGLTMTSVYATKEDIPEVVAVGTMNRMRRRMRFFFVFGGVSLFMAIYFMSDAWNRKRIRRDAANGVEVKKLF